MELRVLIPLVGFPLIGLCLWTGCGDRDQPAPPPAAGPPTHAPVETEGPGPADAPANSRRAEALALFETLAAREYLRGFTVPRGHWIPSPAIAEHPSEKPELLVKHHRDVLLDEVITHERPNPGRPRTLSTSDEAKARRRQARALSLLALSPTTAEAERIRPLLVGDGIWQPWRAALVLAATKDKRWFPDVRKALQEAPTPFGESQVAQALGLLGHPEGAKLVERFMRAHYGRQGYASGKEALVTMAGRGAEAHEAVVQAAFRLIRRHGKGLRTFGGISVQLDHPARVRYLQTTGIEILRRVGTAAQVAELRNETGRLVEPPQSLLDYLAESLGVMRKREAP